MKVVADLQTGAADIANATQAAMKGVGKDRVVIKDSANTPFETAIRTAIGIAIGAMIGIAVGTIIGAILIRITG